MIFAVEGIDGSGKSSLVWELIQRNPKWIPIRFPGQTKEGQLLRELILNPNFGLYPIPEFFAFMTDFCQTHALLDYDEVYIMDRSCYSLLVHQVWGNENLSSSKKRIMEQMILDFIPVPILTFILHLPWQEAKKRSTTYEYGEPDNIENATDESWIRRSELYFRLPDRLAFREFTLYDCTEYPLPALADAVEKEIKEVISQGVC